MRHQTAGASYDEAPRVTYRAGRRGPGGQGPADFDACRKVLLGLLCVIVAAVALRLFWLQVIDGPRLASEAEGRRTNVVTLTARRGTIYDRNGKVLAMSVECQTIYANPKVVENASAVAQVLAQNLGGVASDYVGDLTADTTFRYIKRQVDQDVADKIEQELSDQGLAGIYYLKDSKRIYPYGSTGAQILGFVGSEGTGLSGLEYYYNDILTGTDGQMIMETGLGGTPIAGGTSEVTEAQNGTDIMLSVDIDLQEEAERIIAEGVETYQSESGSVMVSDPKTGEIYAACSTPLPDFSNLTDSSSLDLKLVSQSYEPGSVFKVITTSIGYDLGLYTPDTVYNVPARYTLGDNYVQDDDGRDYAEDMTLRYMLHHSSNPAMALLANDVIGPKRFAEGVERFCIGQKTGIDFPGETTGIVKSYDEYDGTTAGYMAFGQSVAIPMIQIVRAFAAVGNQGTLTTPHFLIAKAGEKVDWPSGGQAISSEACEQEIDAMRAVMTDGTGKNGAVDGYDIAGKTGTGEQAKDGSDGYEGYYYVASLCGFANANDPEVLVYVGLNGTSHLALGSAAHIFHDVMQQSVAILGIAPAN